MILALDFDHTLFDSDAYKRTVTEAGHLNLLFTPAVVDLVGPSPFMYSDVVPFLISQAHEDIYIVSAVSEQYGLLSREYQKRKIEYSGVTVHVHEVVLTGVSKVPALKELMKHGKVITFLDDRVEVVNEVSRELPMIRSVLMLREGRALDGTVAVAVPTVRSLAEFERVISSYA